MKVAEEGNTLEWNEVDHYLDCRYVSSTEAAWKLLEFPLTGRSHSVFTLPLHLEGGQGVFINQDFNDENVQHAMDRSSKLLSWFQLNGRDMVAREYTYCEIPEHYTWHNREGRWERRRQVSKTIGQLCDVSPTDVELYHLRILLRHVKGATSFDDLKTVHGTIQHNFYSACKELGLITTTDEYGRCLQELASKYSPRSVRRTFALICCMV